MLVFIIFKDVIVIVIINVIVLGTIIILKIILIFYNNLPLLKIKKLKLSQNLKLKILFIKLVNNSTFINQSILL